MTADSAPPRRWEWPQDGYRCAGVELRAEQLTWYAECQSGWGGGGGTEQAGADFLQRGPAVSGAPPEILNELRSLLAGEHS